MGNVVDGRRIRYLNLPADEVKRLAVAQLSDNEHRKSRACGRSGVTPIILARPLRLISGEKQRILMPLLIFHFIVTPVNAFVPKIGAHYAPGIDEFGNRLFFGCQ
jgi:hypothetical protein